MTDKYIKVFYVEFFENYSMFFLKMIKFLKYGIIYN